MELISRTEDGLYRLPAFIDAHVHVESSHLTPAGLEFMLADAKRSPADLRFALTSCVPATPFETSGATLSAADTARLFAAHPELIALGEMMNVPGVLANDPEVLGKIAAGMTVFIREGSAAKNLSDLPLPIAGLMSARPAADVGGSGRSIVRRRDVSFHAR